MSDFGGFVRHAFAFLEDEGFTFRGENDGMPLFAEVTYARRAISVRVKWDGRDRACWTTLVRRRSRIWPFAEELGLGHLHRDGESRHDLADPRNDAQPLVEALERQASLLHGPGRALLEGNRGAWAELRARQAEYIHQATR